MLKAKNEQAGGGAVDVPEFALARVPLDRVSTALDVGCGWGRFALPLARRSSIHLTCMDVWVGMVESCWRTLADAGLGAGFLVGDARAIPAPAGAPNVPQGADPLATVAVTTAVGPPPRPPGAVPPGASASLPMERAIVVVTRAASDVGSSGRSWLTAARLTAR